MDRPRLRTLTRLCRPHGLAGPLCLLGLGCAELHAQNASPPAAVRASGEVIDLPPGTPLALQPPPPAPEAPAKVLPISLDTVLRLAEEQNPRIASTREGLRAACAEKDVAQRRWLPDLYLGNAFYRHEGGIQDPDGRFIHSSTGAIFSGLEMRALYDIRDIAFQIVSAERKAWQEKGEVSRVTSEVLLDAANTYIDLLAAHTGGAIAGSLIHELEELLQRAENLLPHEPGILFQVETVRAELANQQQMRWKLKHQADGASAKLVYLLGLDPCVCLLPVDERIVPIGLVDVSQPTCVLVEQALRYGPGIRELEGILCLIQEAQEKARGPGRFLPIFEVRMAEGGFGAGPGAGWEWDNRWDLGVQLRWNLTELATVHDRRRVAAARMNQAHLAYEELKGKLAAGITEAQGAVCTARERLVLGERQIGHARTSLDKSKERLRNNIPGATYTEVVLAQRSLVGAQVNYLTALREHNQAQVRLLVLLGAATGPGPGATAVTAGPPPACPPTGPTPVPYNEMPRGPQPHVPRLPDGR